MIIERFKIEAHEEKFEELLASRNMDVQAILDDIPLHGFMIFDNDDEPVAAGFLRFIEGPYGLLDSYISNPKHTSSERSEAFDMITESLLRLAKRFDLKKLFAFSLETNLINRACSFGFHRVAYEFCTLEIGDKTCHS